MALTQISTAGVKDDAVTSGKIPANAVGSSELADNAVDTAAIVDQAVDLTKLPHGTSSNDGKFLRANNGADPSFESIPAGITINNQADNRVITATGTTDTLNGESNVVIDSSGRLMIGTTTEGNGDGDDLTIATSGRTGMTIRSADDDYGNIFFSDSTSGASEYVGKIQYYHADNTMRFATNSTDRVRLESGGNLKILDGDLVIGASGHGIDFSDTSDASGMTSELLDDYEEGTWTPTFVSTGATFSYNHQYGYYQKVGNTVHVSFYITLSNSSPLSGTTTNNLNIAVPFQATNATRYEAACCFSMIYKFNLNGGASDILLTGRLYSGESKINLLAQFDDAAGYAYPAVKADQPGCGLAGSITYRVHE